jgi:hypothetical protein
MLLFALLGCVTLTLGAADPPSKNDKSDSSRRDKSQPTSGTSGSPTRERGSERPPLELPPDSILALFDNLDEALKQMPRAIVMTPEHYQTLKAELDRLRRQVLRARLQAPARCVLKGKVDGNTVTLSAEFEFETRQPDTLVWLACGQGLATGVSLDGRTPRLRKIGTGARGADRMEETNGDREQSEHRSRTEQSEHRSRADGFVVEIDRPGRHLMTLDPGGYPGCGWARLHPRFAQDRGHPTGRRAACWRQ